MILTRTDWRLLRTALVAAIPVEVGGVWWLYRILLFDTEPATKPGYVQLWGGIATVIVHYPALRLLASPISNHWMLTRSVLFVVGYIDLILLFIMALLLYRGIKWFISTPWTAPD